jgi:SAM-dependent methyltransferase
MSAGYVHGHGPREAERLRDQASTLADLLHHDTVFGDGASVLEAGCGVGAQTVTVAPRNPGARFTSVDVSARSLAEAKRHVREAGIANVDFLHADLYDLPFAAGTFDHVLVCFVLEHLADPVGALRALKRVLKPGGTITVIEGDHGSAMFHPDSDAATSRRKRADRPRALPVAARGALRRGARAAAVGLRRRKPARAGRRLHAQDVHRDDRGRA